MKIYGRTQDDESELTLLTESMIVAEPQTIRELASFLYRCADSIEDLGEAFEHEEFESIDVACPKITVLNPSLLDE